MPAHGLTDAQQGIIIALGSVFDTPPPLIGGGVRVCFFFTFSRSELDKCCPGTYNERMEVLPSAPYWRAGKVLPVFVPAPLQHRAWRINPNTLSGFAHGSRSWRYQIGRTAQDAPQGRMSGARSQICRDTVEARHTCRRGRTGARRGFPALTPAHGSLKHDAGSCSEAKEKPAQRLTKAPSGQYNEHTKRRCRLTVSPLKVL